MFARIVFAALLIAAAPPALAAEDVPLPPITPKGEYFVMTRDDTTTSSKCIGDPKTPMCAVETVLACLSRADNELCRIGMGLESVYEMTHGFLHLPTLYRVARREILTDRRFPWKPERDLPWRPGEIGMRPGDVRVDIDSRMCEKGREISAAACDREPRIAYIVRRQGESWAVIDWGPTRQCVDFMTTPALIRAFLPKESLC